MTKNTDKIKRNHRYGVSSKYAFGRWDYVVYGPFQTEEQAQAWLDMEENDFRYRELCSMNAARKIAGYAAVRNAIEPYEE